MKLHQILLIVLLIAEAIVLGIAIQINRDTPKQLDELTVCLSTPGNVLLFENFKFIDCDTGDEIDQLFLIHNKWVHTKYVHLKIETDGSKL